MAESCAVCRRKKLVGLLDAGVGLSEAARQCGMSRAKAYKWKARFAQEGALGLADRSRARKDAGRLEGALAERLVALRLKHPTWGPRKLLLRLGRQGVRRDVLPAPSTVGALLQRRGLVAPRARRPRATSAAPFGYAGPAPTRPNARWTMDFKGDFLLGNGRRCYPFTLRDAASRKVLCIRAMDSTAEAGVRRELERAFRRYGLPEQLQSDRGTPFATLGLGGLSRLSVWLLKLDVVPVLSRPAKPQDNGGHERMHRDLKAETTRPPGWDLVAQQRKHNRFMHVFNTQRPHDALGGGVPEEHWAPSPRTLPRLLPAPHYPGWWEVRRVNAAAATFSWRDTPVKINDALGGEDIGLEPIDEGLWRVHFYRYAIGLLDERGRKPCLLGLALEAGALPRR